jgi:ABC-type protease/lipase transport system fused ATPase/permease subunit
MTGIHDMILKLPEGYNTRLGDPYAPAPLSGGQIQRLGLARAVYGMPKFVVLDEPNANLDMAGDKALSETIKALRAAGSSVIVMAHRPSVLSAVNKLMVLSAGKMGAFGDRDVLLAEDFKANRKRNTPPKPAPVADIPQTPAKPALEPLPVVVPAQENMILKARRKQIAARAKNLKAVAAEQPKVVRMAGPASRRERA